MNTLNKYTKKPNGNYSLTLDDGDILTLFQNNNNFGFWNYNIRQPDGTTIWGEEEQATAAALAEVLEDVWEDIAKAMGSIR